MSKIGTNEKLPAPWEDEQNGESKPWADQNTLSDELSVRFAEPYGVCANMLGFKTVGRDGSDVFTPLCNYVPYIQTELTYDDGADQTKKYRIAGVDENGKELPTIDVPAKDLEKMDWMLNHWDAACDICVTGRAKDHVRAAIKSTGHFAEKKWIFAHTGWRRIDGKWQYLLPGSTEYEVQLQGKQKNYVGGNTCEFDDLAKLFGLLVVGVAPEEVLYPCIATAFLSPLNEFLKQVGYEPKFILALIGRSGSKKSTLAALILSFFGKFTLTDLPMSFHDTANSIIFNGFDLKDVLTCVDDYHPTAKRDSDSMKSIMQTLARGYGDRAGRNRLTPDITLRESRPPQGNLIVTAEFPPDIGESGTARLFCVEMTPSDLNLPLLSDVQEYAADGVFRRCMFGYTEWLKSEFLKDAESEQRFWADLKTLYESRRNHWRSKLKEMNIVFHDRLPDTLACLEVGFLFLLKFLCRQGILKADVSEDYENAFDDALLLLSERQAKAVEQDRPTHIYLRKLMALLECGQVHVIPKDAAYELPTGCVGYEDSERYYLFFEMTHKAVKKLCADQDETFAISSKALAKALAEEGFAEADNNGANTKPMRFGGKLKRVLVLRKEDVEKIRAV